MRIIVFAVLLCTLVFGEGRSTDLHYKVTFGYVGKVGEARGEFSVDAQNRYRIAVTARATGIAARLSHGRIETLESVGTVVDGVFVPETYTNIRRKSSKSEKDIVIYRFDHAAKQVVKEKTRYSKTKTRKYEDRVTPFYASNDILSLFFNHLEEIKNAKPGEHFRFRAIGSGHKDGFIDMEFPKGKKLEALEETLDAGSEGVFLIATIHQEIFTSKSGELFLHLSKEGVATRAVLKDVALFGDFAARLE